jgi:hypothetical protein
MAKAKKQKEPATPKFIQVDNVIHNNTVYNGVLETKDIPPDHLAALLSKKNSHAVKIFTPSQPKIDGTISTAPFANVLEAEKIVDERQARRRALAKAAGIPMETTEST